MARLEHVNLTVRDVFATAEVLQRAFGWRIRWSGKSSDGTKDAIHVGEDDTYIAMFSASEGAPDAPERYSHAGTLSHIGVVVEDLEATEARVKDAGFTPHAHFDYEPGRRFYFEGPDGIEYEVVCYR